MENCILSQVKGLAIVLTLLSFMGKLELAAGEGNEETLFLGDLGSPLFKTSILQINH